MGLDDVDFAKFNRTPSEFTIARYANTLADTCVRRMSIVNKYKGFESGEYAKLHYSNINNY